MNNYTLEQSLGAGNYGQVFLMRHKDTQQLFVCKKIDLSSKTPQQRKEAENEVQAMSKVVHPNVVGFHEAFIESNVMHIIMEYCDGSDLEKVLLQHCKDKTVMPESTIIPIVTQAALGLRQLHKLHLMHRDLKSANIFLTSSGGVRLGDFGFSKQLNYTMALANTVCGTPYYFAPELCQKLPYNNKADVWSLGVVLYEMINLRKPFEAKTLKELRMRVVTQECAQFTATHVSNELKELCLLMLRKSPTSRPSIELLLQQPILRKQLASMSNSLSSRGIAAQKRTAEIVAAHKKIEGEAPAKADSQSVAANFKVKVDPKMMRQVMASGDAATAPGLQAPKQAEAPVQKLHSRMINARDQVSINAPANVVAELHKEMSEAEHCMQLKTDVDDVLSAEPSGASDAADIGEPQDELELSLRKTLGDGNFVKAVELMIASTENAPDTVGREKAYNELIKLLGDKQYLLTDIQKVSMLFELQ